MHAEVATRTTAAPPTADAGRRAPATLHDVAAEAERIMTICNACRYCEGYCAAFPAMERRLSFAPADLRYLANLCHQCGECYYACQYAPPHEFAVNVPRTFARLRVESYRRYAWPGFMQAAFDRSGTFTALAVAFGAAVLLAVAVWLSGGARALVTPVPGGNFYALIPHVPMASLFAAAFGYAVLAMGVGVARFWRDAGEPDASLAQPGAWRTAFADALSLRNLHGGGEGCPSPGEPRSGLRRTLHHFAFYGFLLCFASTSVATVYHYAFGWEAPYAYLSLPKVLGNLGGVGLLVGSVGLLWLRRARGDARTHDPAQKPLDAGFAVLLAATAASGLALQFLRETALLGALLVVHLGLVLALFVTLPYGKFVHGLYRTAALLRNALERDRPVAAAD